MITATKSEFAAMVNLSPGRISQLIKDGRISPGALEGEGRNARIIVDRAKSELARTLDPSQSFGLNGMKTRAALTGAATPPLSPVPDTSQMILQEKLVQARLQTLRMQRDEALEEGRYILADEAKAKIAAAASQTLAILETGQSAMADAVMALILRMRDEKTEISARDIEVTIEQVFRSLRIKAAESQTRRGDAIRAAEAEAMRAALRDEDLDEGDDATSSEAVSA